MQGESNLTPAGHTTDTNAVASPIEMAPQTADTDFNESAGGIARYLRKLPINAVLSIAVIVTGVLAGLATELIRFFIKWITRLAFYNISLSGPNYRYIWIPVAGILLTYLFMRYILRADVSKGTGALKAHIRNNKILLAPKLMWGSIVACSLTLGGGGSAGAEGPSAYTAGAVGSNIGRWFGLSDYWIKVLLMCGAGAGIAGIFKAPIGGVLFTLEILAAPLTTWGVILLIGACLISYGTVMALSGFQFDIDFFAADAFDFKLFMWVILLGIFCGCYSLWYNYFKNKCSTFLNNRKSPWIKILMTGLFTGLSIFIFPILYGEGYGEVGQLLQNVTFGITEYSMWHGSILPSQTELLLILAGALLLKGGLVAAANHGGGCAGDFAPTLFAGALAGYLFASLINLWFGAGLPSTHFALVGMAAVMAGTIQAPLMAIFITLEMTDSYSYVLAFVVASYISYFIGRRIHS